MDLKDFTKTELRMLVLLADGKPHTRKELHKCLEDEMGPLVNIKPHIQAIKRKIQPHGEDIVCVLGQRRIISYRRVKVLNPEANGVQKTKQAELMQDAG